MTADPLGCLLGIYLGVATCSLVQLSAGSKETIPFWQSDLGSSLGVAKALISRTSLRTQKGGK